MTLTLSKPKPAHWLVDESLLAENDLQYDLFLEVGFEQFSVCVVEVNSKFSSALVQYHLQKVNSWVSLVEKLEEVFNGEDLFKRKYRKVHCSVINQKSTLVPSAVFEKEKEALLLGLNVSLEVEDLIYSERLKQMDAVNVFAISAVLKLGIQKQFPLVEFHHYSTALLENILLENKKNSDNNVVVNVHVSYFEIVLVNQKNLIFYNTFHYTCAEDVVYYLLFVFEQFNINAETIKVTITGELDRNSTIYSLLYKYVRELSFGQKPSSLKYCSKLETLPKHFFYSLYSLQLCV